VRLRIQILASVVAAGFAFGQVSPAQPPSFKFASGETTTIPVEVIANGLVFVEVKVNGHPGSFILDNASQGFNVDREYARRMSLETSSTATARGAGAGAIEAGIIRDVQLSMPGLDLTHRVLIAIDL
jgi:hypothetical protein